MQCEVNSAADDSSSTSHRCPICLKPCTCEDELLYGECIHCDPDALGGDDPDLLGGYIPSSPRRAVDLRDDLIAGIDMLPEIDMPMVEEE